MNEVEVHRRADRVCPEAGRERHDRGGYLPQDGDQPGHVLRLAPEVRGLGVAELRQLENRKLKQLVADLSLDKVMLQDVLSKKL